MIFYVDGHGQTVNQVLSCSVPQGFLGVTLVAYDGIFRITLHTGCNLAYYTDDTLVVVK